MIKNGKAVQNIDTVGIKSATGRSNKKKKKKIPGNITFPGKIMELVT